MDLHTFAAALAQIEADWDERYPDMERPWRLEWTTAFSAAACVEGWDLFDSFGSGSGPWQIQAFDSPEDGDGDLGGEDTIAWVIVRRQATPHARTALWFLAHHNPLEYRRIMAWPTVVEGWWDYGAKAGGAVRWDRDPELSPLEEATT